MSYAANLETAKVFLKVGQKKQARESLLRAMAGIPPEEKSGDNVGYLKTLAMLAKMHVEDSDWDRALVCVEEGLSAKPDHVDLVFLKILYFLDMKRYDEMLAMCGIYLLSYGTDAEYDYEFNNGKVLNEVYTNFLPLLRQRCADREQVRSVIARLADASQKPELTRAVEILSGAAS